MPSILDGHAAESAKARDTIRRAYLRTMAAEWGFPVDLRDIALREIAAMAELVQDLDAPPRRR